MKKYILILFSVLYFCNFAFTETFIGKKILSFDLDYLVIVLKNNGWGLGVNYEIQLFKFFSIRPGFSHLTVLPRDLDLVCTTVGIKLDLLFYPFFNGLEGPYIGCGNSCDFIQFSGEPSLDKETAIALRPFGGWKFSIFDYVFIDAFVGYRFLLNESQFKIQGVTDFYGNKVEYGAKVKFNLKKIWNKLREKSKSKKNAKNTDYNNCTETDESISL